MFGQFQAPFDAFKTQRDRVQPARDAGVAPRQGAGPALAFAHAIRHPIALLIDAAKEGKALGSWRGAREAGMAATGTSQKAGPGAMGSLTNTAATGPSRTEAGRAGRRRLDRDHPKRLPGIV